jgi:hypothetical protein
LLAEAALAIRAYTLQMAVEVVEVLAVFLFTTATP